MFTDLQVRQIDARGQCAAIIGPAVPGDGMGSRLDISGQQRDDSSPPRIEDSQATLAALIEYEFQARARIGGVGVD